jgi:hypothetical protein
VAREAIRGPGPRQVGRPGAHALSVEGHAQALEDLHCLTQVGGAGRGLADGQVAFAEAFQGDGLAVAEVPSGLATAVCRPRASKENRVTFPAPSVTWVASPAESYPKLVATPAGEVTEDFHVPLGFVAVAAYDVVVV